MIKVGENLTDFVGSLDYLAPEIVLGQPYDFAVDIWAMGVITYVILAGFPPFEGETMAELFPQIKKAEYGFDGEEWEPVSNNAKKFVRRLMNPNPKHRPTANEALQDEWIVSHTSPKPQALSAAHRLGSVRNIQKMVANKKKRPEAGDSDQE